MSACRGQGSSVRQAAQWSAIMVFAGSFELTVTTEGDMSYDIFNTLNTSEVVCSSIFLRTGSSLH